MLDDEAPVPVPAAPQPPIPPRLLGQLATFAQGRLAAGEAGELLGNLGADQPKLIDTYRIGYLPAGYLGAVAKADRRLLTGLALGNRLIFPASDDAGQVVDLFAVGMTNGNPATAGTRDDPLGLLAPTLATAYSELMITDAVSLLTDCFRQGFPNTLLLRGAVDAKQHAKRLWDSGVRRVILRTRHDRGAIPDALAAAGIDVSGKTSVAVLSPEPAAPAPEPAPALRIIGDDRTAEVVTCEAGPIRYTVERRPPGSDPRRLVVVRCRDRVAQDRLDLDSEPQRRRFAGNAGQRLGVVADLIAEHLGQVVPLLAGKQQEDENRHRLAVPDTERQDAEAMLAAPDLLARVCADLTALGWVGEDRAKAVLFLTAISRHLAQPMWTCYRGTAPWQSTALIAALTPPEERLVFHRLTDGALRQQDATNLRHRLLVVDQAESIRPEAAIALRVLKERGSIGWATLAQENAGEARGPVAVIAAAAADLDRRCRDAFVILGADERPEHTAQVLAAQRHRHGAAINSPGAEAAIVARHHAMQRLLERKPVVIPDADRISFPSHQTKSRGEQAWFLSLVEAIAFLRQRQRLSEQGAILASEADIRLAMTLSEGVIATARDGLGQAGRNLLAALTAGGLARFTMADLGGILPDWTRWTLRAALDDLLDFGYLEATPSRRGRGNLREYSLTTRSTTGAVPGIVLRAERSITRNEMAEEMVKMAENGGRLPAILSPWAANG